jgi:hypothetical protein
MSPVPKQTWEGRKEGQDGRSPSLSLYRTRPVWGLTKSGSDRHLTAASTPISFFSVRGAITACYLGCAVGVGRGGVGKDGVDSKDRRSGVKCREPVVGLLPVESSRPGSTSTDRPSRSIGEDTPC